MKYHLVFHRKVDLDAIRHDSDNGECPRHAIDMMVGRLDATVHMPGDEQITVADRVRSKAYGRPEVWAMARSLAGQVSADDVIYCSGEDVGLPVAALCGGRLNSPTIAMYVHNVNRPRCRLLLEWFGLAGRIQLFFGNNESQLTYLRDSLGLPESRVHRMQEQTDVKFFTPGPPSSSKTRPIIASVGLEQRDYRTLAEATQDLDVDVRISGFSQDAAVMHRAFPDTMPANMSRNFYSWPELVQLYRDADVVALSLFPCEYAAGITTLLEGFACRRPVVATQTNGLTNYLDPDSVLITDPSNPAQLRAAIVRLLEDRKLASSIAERGHEIALERHDSDRFVDEIACSLESIAIPTSLARVARTLSYPGAPAA